ncbi:hypothetical protein SCP_0305900 [Sparassis crispa]|uniref:Uncharacterized protein n=1 Tax=Sparassis crispa TaxID=139825 RepID=A0A401GFC3_9APHY|nr:hypothetical protein SCP_0305900 [Sparassis crispa]GBE80870.1 hypothetical protein SCP_0305900 [Sparassis crispa]
MLAEIGRAITASVRMSSPDSTGGAFKVSTQTSNGPVHVHFVDSPVDTYLDFSARTSNAPAGASLHRAYEGSFSLHTTHKAPVLHISEHAEDPSGRARGRNVTSSRWRSGLEGSVAWGNPPYDQPLGSASVQSTNSAVTLELQ